MNAGIALIPNSETLAKIVQVENAVHNDFMFSDKLGLTINIPHITLYQGDMKDDVEYKKMIRKVAKQVRNSITTIKLTNIEYVPDGWYFWMCEESKELFALHKFVLRQCVPFVSEESRHQYSSKMPAMQKESVRRFGYCYAGNAFMPHITIGRTKSGENSFITNKLQEELSPRSITVGKVSAYLMGRNGTYIEPLADAII